MVLLGVQGHFPPLLAWLWYLLNSCTAVLALSALISLYVTRIYVIKKVQDATDIL